MSDRSEKAQVTRLLVQLGRDESMDDVELSDLTGLLRRELEDFRFVTAVEQRFGTDDGDIVPPKGAKAGECIALGALLMAVLPEAIPTVIEFLKEWALRPGNHHVKIKVQSREDSMEIEFDPHTMSKDEVIRLALKMKSQLRSRR